MKVLVCMLSHGTNDSVSLPVGYFLQGEKKKSLVVSGAAGQASYYLQLNTLLSNTKARTTDWILLCPLHLWSLRSNCPPSATKNFPLFLILSLKTSLGTLFHQ